RLRPALDRLVNGLHRRLISGMGREVIECAAVQPIAGADPDLFETVEHVQLGERDAGDARDRAGLADQHGIEPAAAALAAGDGAELAAALAQTLADCVI